MRLTVSSSDLRTTFYDVLSEYDDIEDIDSVVERLIDALENEFVTDYHERDDD